MRNFDTWLEVRVGSICDISPTIREFRLDGIPYGSCSPGAHINIRVFIDGLPDYRSYSVTRQMPDGSLFIAVKLLEDSRGGSAYMWSLNVGSFLHITPPACDFELQYGQEHYLLIAGGIGITPIYSMAMALREHGSSVRLLYAARSREELAYQDVLSESLGESVVFFPAEEGYSLDVAEEIASLPSNGELYVCGPLGLMESVKDIWALSNRLPTKLHFETFGSSGRYATVPFRVRVPRLGLEIEVPKNKSMLDALQEAGVPILSECRRGECGLCAVDIIDVSGDVDHRDVFFSSVEHQKVKRMCACVSRLAGGEVSIDPAWRKDPILR